MGLFSGAARWPVESSMGPLTSDNTVGRTCEARGIIVLHRLRRRNRPSSRHGTPVWLSRCRASIDPLLRASACPSRPKNATKFSHSRALRHRLLVMTVMVAIVVHTLVPVGAWADTTRDRGIARSLFVFASRIAMLPLVAGLSCQVTVKWAGSHPENPLVKIAWRASLMMQKLTTRTADEEMLECAIAALKLVDEHERKVDRASPGLLPRCHRQVSHAGFLLEGMAMLSRTTRFLAGRNDDGVER